MIEAVLSWIICLAEFPDMAMTYSRGSQGWVGFNEEWMKLTDKGIFLGPPHRIMATRAFPPLLKKRAKRRCPFWLHSSIFQQRCIC